MKTITKPNSVFVQDHQILINSTKEFAILEKRPNAKGYQGITFSTSLTAADVVVINGSGIAQVISFSESGTLLFKRKDFYENTKMYELIIDILSRHETKKREPQYMAEN